MIPYQGAGAISASGNRSDVIQDVSVVFCKTLLKGYDHHQDSPFSKTDYIQSILGEQFGLSHFSI